MTSLFIPATGPQPLEPPTDADYANQLRGAIVAANSALEVLRKRGFTVEIEHDYNECGDKVLSVVTIGKTERITL